MVERAIPKMSNNFAPADRGVKWGIWSRLKTPLSNGQIIVLTSAIARGHSRLGGTHAGHQKQPPMHHPTPTSRREAPDAEPPAQCHRREGKYHAGRGGRYYRRKPPPARRLTPPPVNCILLRNFTFPSKTLDAAAVWVDFLCPWWQRCVAQG